MTPNLPSDVKVARAAVGAGRQAVGIRFQIDRGPDCLVVKLETSEDEEVTPDRLSEALWSLLQRHLVYRLILDLHDVELLHSVLLGQLIALRKRVIEQNGSLRLCGLSATNQRVLHVHKLHGRLPHYASRRDALMQHCPPKG